MARPKKYTGRTLKKAVERYFDTISREVGLTEKVDSGRRDGSGHVIYETVPITNKLGEQVTVTQFVVPPTVGGLCEFLGIHRSTWAGYCEDEEFSDTTTRARGRMRAWCEGELLTRKDVKGIIFNLQNNYDYRERREIELGPGAAKAAAAGSMTAAERLAILKEIAGEFDGKGADDGTDEG